MRLLINLFIIFILLISISIDKSLSLSTQEINALDLIYGTFVGGVLSPEQYCQPPNKCNTEGSLITLNITTAPTTVIEFDTPNLSGLGSLVTLSLYQFNIGQDFINTKPTNLFNLYLINCWIPTLIAVPWSYDILYIVDPKEKVQATISNLAILGVLELTMTGKNFATSYTTDGFEDGGRIRHLALTCNSVPNLSGLVGLKYLEYSFGSSFLPTDSTDGVLSFGKTLALKIGSYADQLLPFPTQIFDLAPRSPNVESFTIIGPFSADSELDFSGISSKLKTLSLTKVGDSFNANGGIPISTLPKGIDFTLSGGNFINVPNFSLFNELSSVKLTENIFTGSLPSVPEIINVNGGISIINNDLQGVVPESYCNIDIRKLSLKGNKLNGNLPSCFSCYFGNPVIEDNFSGNNFTYIKDCKNDISPSVEIVTTPQNTQIISLKGLNLGFDFNAISSEPSLTWSLIKPSTLFESSAFTSTGVKKMKIIFKDASLNYTLALDKTVPPSITKVERETGTSKFLIRGDFFSNKYSNVSVSIDGLSCVVNPETTFNLINCAVDSFNETSTHSLIKVTIDSTRTTSVYVSLQDNALNNKACTTCQSNGGVCNLLNSVCECFSGFKGSSCETCEKGWTGTKCDLVDPFGESFSTTTEAGGIVNIGGWFGPSPIPSDFKIMMGTTPCVILVIQPKFTNCTIGPGTGPKVVKITYQDTRTFTTPGPGFVYVPDVKNCPKACVHGSCNTNKGICECEKGYSGLDCSSIANNGGSTSSGGSGGDTTIPGSNTNVNSSTGGTSINNQQTNYEIYLSNLLEINLNGETVHSYPLKNNWKVLNTTIEDRVIFTQEIKDGCRLTFTIDDISLGKYPNGKEYTFAGVDFLVSGGSLKMQFEINNFTYDSSLNSLQLLMESSVSELKVDNQDDCSENVQDPTIEAIESGGTLNYLKISKDNKIFYGRFIDRALSENRPTFISSSIVKKTETTVTVGINLPHCSNCIIDPDFSVLVAPSFVSTCSNSRASWVLPVAIVVPCVAVVLIIIVTVIIVKKNRMTLKLKLNKFKSFSMKSFKN